MTRRSDYCASASKSPAQKFYHSSYALVLRHCNGKRPLSTNEANVCIARNNVQSSIAAFVVSVEKHHGDVMRILDTIGGVTLADREYQDALRALGEAG